MELHVPHPKDDFLPRGDPEELQDRGGPSLTCQISHLHNLHVTFTTGLFSVGLGLVSVVCRSDVHEEVWPKPGSGSPLVHRCQRRKKT